MLKSIAKKAFKILTGRPVKKKIDPWKEIEKLSQKSVPSQGEFDFQFALESRGQFERQPMTATINNDLALARLFTGHKIFVNPKDLSMAPHLMLDGVWENHITRVVGKLLKRDCVFLDLGAGFGYYSLIAATQIHSSPDHIRIHSFEPNPLLASIIAKNIEINGLDRLCKINSLGVSNTDGIETLRYCVSHLGSSSFSPNYKPSEIATECKVRTTTVDSYCVKNGLNKVDLIKIDIEGYEHKAINGMSQTITNNPQLKIIATINTKGSNFGQLFNTLRADFSHISYIDSVGELEPIEKLEDLAARIDGDLCTILLSNERV
jgi:FkbM family methyltransferase